MFEDIPTIITDFLSYMETIKGKSKSTVKEYYYDLRHFVKYLRFMKEDSKENSIQDVDIKNVQIDLIKTVTLSDLYSFMSYLSYDRDNSTRSRARKVASIKSFFNFLHKKSKLIDLNPASELETPKLTKCLPSFLNIDESISLLKSVCGRQEKRDYAILTLFLNCGLRLSELVSINISQIKDNTLIVMGKGQKERTIYLNNACLNSIQAYLLVRPKIKTKSEDALFMSERKQRISNKTVQYLVKKYIKFSGLDSKKYSTHKLRHTAATLMYQHGNVDIRALQEILGHESISTTEIYTHLNDTKLQDAVDKNPLADIKK